MAPGIMAKLVTSLPVEVRQLIERKLRLQKRELEQELVDLRQRCFSRLHKEMRECLGTGAIGRMLIAVPIEIYRELAADVLGMTSRWPLAVWEAITKVLERADIRPSDGIELNSIVDEHAWAHERAPFTLGYVSSDRFKDAVWREADRYGAGRDDMKLSLERQLDIAAASVTAAIHNTGRQVRETVAIAIDEYLIAVVIGNQASTASDEQETPEKRRQRLKNRVKQERAKGTKSFLIVVAEEERISVSRLKQLVKEEPLTTGNWFDPKPKPRGAISKKPKSQY